jgi:hypothetical protein
MSYDLIFVYRSLRATNLSIEVEPEDIFGSYDKTHIYAKESKSILNGNSGVLSDPHRRKIRRLYSHFGSAVEQATLMHSRSLRAYRDRTAMPPTYSRE